VRIIMKRCLIAVAALALAGCFGFEADIDIKQNGSGTIDAVYCVSRELLAIGTRGGNERLPAIPVGRQDFERSVSRVSGLSLAAYSEKDEENDRVFRVKLRFDSLDALAAFLDSQGRSAEAAQTDGKTSLTLSFAVGTALDGGLAEIVPAVFAGYDMDFRLTLPRDCEVRYLDADGGALPAIPYGQTAVETRKVRFQSPIADLLTAPPVSMQILW
jgi:hypothetical protein